VSWDHFVTSISFSTTKSIEFDVIVGSLLSEKTMKKSNLETSTSEAMMVRGTPKERGQVQRDLSPSKSKGKKRNLKVLVLWQIGTPEERLLEATTSLQRRPSKRNEGRERN
jgi:hypothetical protein